MDVDVWNRIRFGDRTVIDHRHDLLAVLPEDGAADFGFMMGILEASCYNNFLVY